MYPFSPKLPSHPGCQELEQSSICYTVGLCWLSILDISVCTCPSPTPYLFLPFPWQPKVCTLSLWVSFCFVSDFICIISFQIPHIRDVICYFSFSIWLTSLNVTISRSICCCKWIYFILFNGWVIFHCINVPHLSSLSIPLSMDSYVASVSWLL